MIQSYYLNGQSQLIDGSSNLFNLEPVKIEGLVSPEGQGATVEDGYMTQVFSLIAWKKKDSKKLINEKLTIYRTVEPKTDFFDEIKTLSLLNLCVYLSFDLKMGLFIDAEIQKNENPLLKEIAIERSKPVIIDSTVIGKLIFDASTSTFEGQNYWDGKNIKISIYNDERCTIEKGLETLKVLIENQLSWNEKIKNYAVQELLKLKNECWLDDDETKLTSSTFLDSIGLKYLIITDDDFSFEFDDGDIFGGHNIMISGTILDGLTSASI
jgi:hypothetical protein